MRILLTNDDGVGAEGLSVLRTIAAGLSDDIWVAAPATEQSNTGRSLTTEDPIRVTRLDERTFAVAGTPTDCVMLGVRELIQGRRPDLVLSGVNRGRNIADDVTTSGTVAAAIEGLMLGVPSVALSQSMAWTEGGLVTDWTAAKAHGQTVLRQALNGGWPEGVILNINFPATTAEAVRGVAVVSQGLWGSHGRRTEARTDLKGRPYFWIGDLPRSVQAGAETDIAALNEGYISLTPLHVDWTHRPSLAALKARFSER